MKKILALLIFLAVTGCSPRSPSAIPPAPTVTNAELINAFNGAATGDASYQLVTEQWMRSFYEEFRQEIFSKGVVKWDPRFDCNHFASYYAALAQTKFYLQSFHSKSQTQSLAIGSFWYRPNGGTAGHAVVAGLTASGPVFLEPQTGQIVRLTRAEIDSAYIKIF